MLKYILKEKVICVSPLSQSQEALTLSLEFEDLVFLNSICFHRSTYAFIHFPPVFKSFFVFYGTI